MGMVFSIIVVCLDAGDRLRETIESIRMQTEQDYEVIIKDGGSTDEVTKRLLKEYESDGSKVQAAYKEREHTESAGHDERFRIYRSKDTGIYDGMNQAVKYVRGDYIFFLNCGDSFYDRNVLAQVKKQIERQSDKGADAGQTEDARRPGNGRQVLHIFYGNIYERKTDMLVQSNPVIDDFACYRNIPCHQACFYDARLFWERGFDIGYRVRADYEHFLWCYYKAQAETVYMPVTVARYEGGGFSETKENRKESQKEHAEVVNRYMPGAKVIKYRLIMALTLAPLRTLMAEHPATAVFYQKLKGKLYKG